MYTDQHPIKTLINERINIIVQKNTTKALIAQKLKDCIFNNFSKEEFISLYLHNDELAIDKKIRQIFWKYVIFDVDVVL